MKKTYILPLFILLVYLVISIFSLLNKVLWIQGYTRYSLNAIIFGLFIIVASIAVIYELSKDNYEYVIVLVPALLLFIFVDFTVMYNSPNNRTFYSNGEQTVLVIYLDDFPGGVYSFYDKDGMFSSRIATCTYDGEDGSFCEYYIEDDTLVVTLWNDDLPEISVVPLQ